MCISNRRAQGWVGLANHEKGGRVYCAGLCVSLAFLFSSPHARDSRSLAIDPVSVLRCKGNHELLKCTIEIQIPSLAVEIVCIGVRP